MAFKKGHEVPQEWRDNLRKYYKGQHHSPKTEFKKGQKSWNKGSHTQSNTGRTHFKKGRIPWNKDRKYLAVTGEKNNNWKGDNVGYQGIHHWIIKWKGQPDTCESCGKTGLKGCQINWANIDHTYKRILDDYIRLCVKCHKKYDKQFKINKQKNVERKN